MSALLAKLALSPEELKEGLRAHLVASGLVDAMTAQLRRKVVSEFDGGMSAKKAFSLKDRLRYSVLVDDLKSQNLSHALAVLVPECGGEAAFSRGELAEALGLPPPAQGSSVLDDVIARLQKTSNRGEASTQTSSIGGDESTLHERLRTISETYASRRARRREDEAAPKSIEELARASEARFAEELKSQVQRIRDVEVARALRAAEATHRDELDRVTDALKADATKRERDLAARERNIEAAFADRLRESGAQAHQQRQELVNERGAASIGRLEKVRDRERSHGKALDSERRALELHEARLLQMEKALEVQQQRHATFAAAPGVAAAALKQAQEDRADALDEARGLRVSLNDRDDRDRDREDRERDGDDWRRADAEAAPPHAPPHAPPPAADTVSVHVQSSPPQRGSPPQRVRRDTLFEEDSPPSRGPRTPPAPRAPDGAVQHLEAELEAERDDNENLRSEVHSLRRLLDATRQAYDALAGLPSSAFGVSSMAALAAGLPQPPPPPSPRTFLANPVLLESAHFLQKAQMQRQAELQRDAQQARPGAPDSGAWQQGYGADEAGAPAAARVAAAEAELARLRGEEFRERARLASLELASAERAAADAERAVAQQRLAAQDAAAANAERAVAQQRLAAQDAADAEHQAHQARLRDDDRATDDARLAEDARRRGEEQLRRSDLASEASSRRDEEQRRSDLAAEASNALAEREAERSRVDDLASETSNALAEREAEGFRVNEAERLRVVDEASALAQNEAAARARDDARARIDAEAADREARRAKAEKEAQDRIAPAKAALPSAAPAVSAPPVVAPPALTAPLSSAPVTARLFALDDVVESRFKGKAAWYAGRVSRLCQGLSAYGSATYDIGYDDGDAEQGVAEHLIRSAPDAVAAAVVPPAAAAALAATVLPTTAAVPFAAAPLVATVLPAAAAAPAAATVLPAAAAALAAIVPPAAAAPIAATVPPTAEVPSASASAAQSRDLQISDDEVSESSSRAFAALADEANDSQCESQTTLGASENRNAADAAQGAEGAAKASDAYISDEVQSLADEALGDETVSPPRSRRPSLEVSPIGGRESAFQAVPQSSPAQPPRAPPDDASPEDLLGPLAFSLKRPSTAEERPYTADSAVSALTEPTLYSEYSEYSDEDDGDDDRTRSRVEAELQRREVVRLAAAEREAAQKADVEARVANAAGKFDSDQLQKFQAAYSLADESRGFVDVSGLLHVLKKLTGELPPRAAVLAMLSEFELWLRGPDGSAEPVVGTASVGEFVALMALQEETVYKPPPESDADAIFRKIMQRNKLRRSADSAPGGIAPDQADAGMRPATAPPAAAARDSAPAVRDSFDEASASDTDASGLLDRSGEHSVENSDYFDSPAHRQSPGAQSDDDYFG